MCPDLKINHHKQYYIVEGYVHIAINECKVYFKHIYK
jgi:hypothetical protein